MWYEEGPYEGAWYLVRCQSNSPRSWSRSCFSWSWMYRFIIASSSPTVLTEYDHAAPKTVSDCLSCSPILLYLQVRKSPDFRLHLPLDRQRQAGYSKDLPVDYYGFFHVASAFVNLGKQ
jgi:hypothetical protein